MYTHYEIVHYSDILPIRTGIFAVDSCRMHWHMEMEILFVLHGSLHVLIQGDAHTLKAGDLIVISPNLIHSTQQSQEPNIVLMLQLHCSKFGFGDSEIDSTVFTCNGSTDSNPRIAQIRELLCRIVMETAEKKAGYGYAAAASIQNLLCILLRHFPHRIERSLSSLKPKDQARLRRIFDYIDANYMHNVSLSDIAMREELSLNHLSTLFKRLIGMGYGEYLASVRMRAFLERLQSDDMTPVDAIAEQCGFSSAHFASARFSRIYGTTPGKYRKHLHSKEALRQTAVVQMDDGATAATHLQADLPALLGPWLRGHPDAFL